MIVVPSRMGRLNKRTLLARLQRLGVASRADLAKSLNMSQPTAGKIADELLALGVLEEVDGEIAGRGRPANGQSRLGRPARMLRLNRSQPRFIALQLGVTETRLAQLPVGAANEDRWTHGFPTPASARSWLGQLRTVGAGFQAQELWGVLVSVPGIVDEPAGRVIFSPNLHWSEQANLPALVREAFGFPVTLVQEERALALGHQAMTPEAEDFLLVDFGDGVGGAMVVGGQLYANPLPISGELGHTPVIGNDRSCGCGAVGCLETLVSSRGLLASLGAVVGNGAITWSGLAQRVRQRGVEPWLAQTLDAAAVAIAGSLNVLGLRRVVVTGSLAELAPPVMDHLRQRIQDGALWARFGNVSVEAAPRRRIAGLVSVGIDRLVLPVRPDAALQNAP